MTPSLSLDASPFSRPLLKRSGHLFTGGGALWIAYYALQLVMGLRDGHVSMEGGIGLLDGACFCGAIVGLCAATITLANALLSKGGALSLAGRGFAAVAAMCMVVGFARAVTLHQPPGMWGGIGVVSSCMGATLVAIAVKRAKALPARLANGLLLIGLLTFPLILAFAWPAGKWLPAFVTDELPFALSGSAYLAFGWGLQLHKETV